MVYISKVYTRSGDGGETMLASGDRVRKDHVRIASYGDVDELNSVIGLVRTELAREPRRTGEDGAQLALDEADQQLGAIQQELFDLGAELSTPDGSSKLRVQPSSIARLEAEIDGWNEALPPLKSFILPGGGAPAAACHLGRTVCRRAERAAIALAHTEGEQVRAEAVHYLNRLSDYLFVLARALSHRLGYDEVLWDATRNKPEP